MIINKDFVMLCFDGGCDSRRRLVMLNILIGMSNGLKSLRFAKIILNTSWFYLARQSVTILTLHACQKVFD